MMKNDYRRALILLRPALAGTSGHVRLERRTLVGSMQFTLSGMQGAGEMQAAMAARMEAGWKIVHIGTLGRDARGQAGLNWTFDPRSIEGLPLERYRVLMVLETGAGRCRALFTGYVNGSVQVDWERVEQAACASYAAAAENGRTAEPDAPEETAPDPAADETQPAPATEDVQIPAEEQPDPNDRLPGTTPIFRDPEGECEPAAEPADEDLPDEPALSARIRSEPLDAPAMSTAVFPDPLDLPASDGEPAQNVVPAMSAAVYEDPFDVPARAAQTALEALGLERGERWPEAIEPLREAFAASAPVFLGAQPDHVFVKAAHSADCPECAVGVRAEAGRPVSVAYAIPGSPAAQPPAGLEGYLWRDGWWIVLADAQTGAYLHI